MIGMLMLYSSTWMLWHASKSSFLFIIQVQYNVFVSRGHSSYVLYRTFMYIYIYIYICTLYTFLPFHSLHEVLSCELFNRGGYQRKMEKGKMNLYAWNRTTCDSWCTWIFTTIVRNMCVGWWRWRWGITIPTHDQTTRFFCFFFQGIDYGAAR